ncbi:MAG TPA: hypothetical protein DCQ06_14605 [Myxococcales bacterium]|nr:hypothetical protein [Myxococcales bacterium]
MKAKILAAAEDFVHALNTPGDLKKVGQACSESIVIERMGVFSQQGQLVETFVGVDAVGSWLARTPAGIEFRVVSAEVADSPTWRVRYAYSVPKEGYHHAGTWLLRLGTDDKITWMQHNPDPSA